MAIVTNNTNTVDKANEVDKAVTTNAAKKADDTTANKTNNAIRADVSVKAVDSDD